MPKERADKLSREIFVDRFYIYKPGPFFLIAILITWTAWFTAAFLSYQPSGGPTGWISILELVGLFGPLSAALWMTLTSGSAELKRDLYEKLFDLKRIRLVTLPAVFLIMPFVAVLSVLFSHLFFEQSLDQLRLVKTASYSAGLMPVPVMFFGAALVEELGWKGYGMESLRGEHTFFKATLFYAVLWTFWHIPLFFIDHYYHNMIFKAHPVFALNFIVSVFSMAFIINWLWYKNRGNILTAILFHAAANVQGILQMGQTAKDIQAVVLLVIAVMTVSFNKNMFFEKFKAQIGYFGPQCG